MPSRDQRYSTSHNADGGAQILRHQRWDAGDKETVKFVLFLKYFAIEPRWRSDGGVEPPQLHLRHFDRP